MDPRRLGIGEALAGVSGVVLILAMTQLDWYGVDVPPGADEISGFDAFSAFSVADVVLLVTAILAIALPVLTMTLSRTDIPVVVTVFVALFGIVSCIFLIVRIIAPPDLTEMENVVLHAVTNLDVETAREAGLYVGFAAAVGIAAGGWLGMRDDGTRKAARTSGSDV